MLEVDNLTNEQQTRMCELCEDHIIGGSHMSYHYMCEGSHCDKAIEYLLEEINENEECEKEKRNEKYKYLLIKIIPC